MRWTSGWYSERWAPRLAALSIGATLAAIAVGCLIQRPPIPSDYIPFRDALRDSVADFTYAELAGKPALEERLRERLVSLATITQTDSLFAALESDAALWTLADGVAAAVGAVLESDAADGGVRTAFRKPEGQRVAVDAVLIGFGEALRRLEVGREGG